MLKKLYLSPFGFLISFVQMFVSILHKPFMVYGFYNRVQRKFVRKTRVSSTAKILSKDLLDIADNVWIWHYTIVDASNRISIGEGAQIGAWVGIFTHSSHVAIRLLGKDYLTSDTRAGYVSAPVTIGEYAFIAAGSIILPGVNIGRGAIVSAGSLVNKSVPDYAIVAGNPAKVIGSIDKLDRPFLSDENIRKSYFDKEFMRNLDLPENF